MTADINDPVINIRGIGPRRAALLKKLGIRTANDVLWFFPRRYADRREICKIAELRPGRNSVVIVKIGTVSCRRSFRTGIQVCSCEAEDGTGTLSVIWFNRKGLGSILTEGTSVALFGLPSFCEGRIEFSNPEFEIVKDASGIAGFTGIVPVYPLTAGLPERWLRKFIDSILENYLPLVKEYLPQSIIEKRGLPDIREALRGCTGPSPNRTGNIAATGWRMRIPVFADSSCIKKREAQKIRKSGKIDRRRALFLCFYVFSAV